MIIIYLLKMVICPVRYLKIPEARWKNTPDRSISTWPTVLERSWNWCRICPSLIHFETKSHIILVGQYSHAIVYIYRLYIDYNYSVYVLLALSSLLVMSTKLSPKLSMSSLRRLEAAESLSSKVRQTTPTPPRPWHAMESGSAWCFFATYHCG